MKPINTGLVLFNLIIISFLFIFMQSACRRVNIEYGVSDCIREKIVSFSKYTCNSGGNVMEYTFQNKIVYVFSQGNCNEELNAEVTTPECVTLGFVTNSAHNIIAGEDFINAEFKRIVWEDK